MPELPEVEIVTTHLAKKLQNKTITSVSVGFEKLLKNSDKHSFISSMEPFMITKLYRLGKYIVFSDETNGKWMTVHLGMTGAFFVVHSSLEIPLRYQKHQHLFFHLDTGETLVYADIRKFGDIRFFSQDPALSYPPFTKLGPNPLIVSDPIDFISNAKSPLFSSKEVKPSLLDSRLLTGVGNIYACEALYRAKIHPQALLRDLSDHSLSELYKIVRDLFIQSIQHGGSSVSDYVNADGQKGDFQNLHQIYQKNVCFVCLRDTQRIIQNKRSTFYCEQCQPFNKK